MDIVERRVPQDGRIKVRTQGREADLRVSTVPTVFGEKVVMRILDKSSLVFDLTRLGFEDEQLERFIEAAERPYGMILMTGPTGSGKTTTLYSALTRLNSSEVNIMTAEDPVEYNFEGINQIQIKEEIGLTFASSLRSFLRQDPDIILVGEIRDFETADIAVKAALTGHLVFSTLHTNDAPSTIARLLDMGLESFLVASSLNLVVAQRLVRKICPDCKREYEPPQSLLERLGLRKKEKVFYKGEGCPSCSHTGYRGRTALYEVMPISKGIMTMVVDGASVDLIREAAIEEGMRTLRESGIDKARQGITALEEVIRVTV
jgi:type IV pilus assembly protein PilB